MNDKIIRYIDWGLLSIIIIMIIWALYHGWANKTEIIITTDCMGNVINSTDWSVLNKVSLNGS